jgi:hypothetical protein
MPGWGACEDYAILAPAPSKLSATAYNIFL